LLDIGIYSLTWGILTLEGEGTDHGIPLVTSAQTLSDGIDVSSSMLLFYPESGRHGILTSTTLHKTDRTFCRVEGSRGTILISGDTASMPDTITIVRKDPNAGQDMGDKKAHDGDQDHGETKVLRFAEHSAFAKGFYYEADHIALRLAEGEIESNVMPLNETLRILHILDSVRKQGGARFPQDPN
jgi:predicted dehydrogenase